MISYEDIEATSAFHSLALAQQGAEKLASIAVTDHKQGDVNVAEFKDYMTRYLRNRGQELHLLDEDERKALNKLEKRGTSLNSMENRQLQDFKKLLLHENRLYKEVLYSFCRTKKAQLYSRLSAQADSLFTRYLEGEREFVSSTLPRYYKELESFDMTFLDEEVSGSLGEGETQSDLDGLPEMKHIGLSFEIGDFRRIFSLETKMKLTSGTETDGRKLDELRPAGVDVAASNDHDTLMQLNRLLEVNAVDAVIDDVSFAALLSLERDFMIPVRIMEFKRDLENPCKIIFIDRKLLPREVSPAFVNGLFFKQVYKDLAMERKEEVSKGGSSWNILRVGRSVDPKVLSIHQLGKFRLLVRNSVDGYVPDVDGGKLNRKLAVIRVKMDLMPEIGLDESSLGEIARNWAILSTLPPGSSLLRARIEPSTLTLLGVQDLKIGDLVAPASLFNPSEALSLVRNLLCRLSKLEIGNYLLREARNRPILNIMRCVGDSPSDPENCYDLHESVNTFGVLNNALTKILPPKCSHTSNIPYTFPIDVRKEITRAKKRRRKRKDLDTPREDQQGSIGNEGGDELFLRSLESYKRNKGQRQRNVRGKRKSRSRKP